MGCSSSKQGTDPYRPGGQGRQQYDQQPGPEYAEDEEAYDEEEEEGPVYATRMLYHWSQMTEEEIAEAQEEADIRMEYAVGPPLSDGGVPVLITMCPAEASGRTPSDIVCVIDISWSMTMEAKVVGGNTESNGLSMLDVAKHAVRAVIHTLGPQDRLGIVEFCREATVVFPMTKMTAQGREEADHALDGITFGNGTKLWQGIKAGLDQLRLTQRDNRIGHLMVLTDGETEDRLEVMDCLKQARAENDGKLQGTINCFGFGYEIDSALLAEVARFSDGSYAFIPDAGFVGTIFVNSISNLLVTMSREVYLTLKAKEKDDVPRLLTDGYDYAEMPDGSVKIALGLLQVGQTRDLVLRMNQGTSIREPFEYCVLSYHTAPWNAPPLEREGKAAPRGSKDGAIEVNLQRSLFLRDLQASITLVGQGKSCVEAELDQGFDLLEVCARRVRDSVTNSDDMELKALLDDVTGEVGVAFATKDNWDKWGRHYAPSVMFAHRLQQCNNFKDPGVQFYGGDIFGEVRDMADEAFNKLAAPRVTPAQFRYLGGGKVIENPSYQRDRAVAMGTTPSGGAGGAHISMAAYNDRFAGCIDGACSAALGSGGTKLVADLVKGDMVACADGETAEVVCVVRTECPGGVAHLVELPGGARLTPHHPALIGGGWRFPADLAAISPFPCKAVYTFVLNGGTNLLVGGVPCISLGHGLREGAAAHPYLGSRLVLEDLARAPGYSAGLIELRPEDTGRDPETGLVRRLAPQGCGRQEA